MFPDLIWQMSDLRLASVHTERQTDLQVLGGFSIRDYLVCVDRSVSTHLA